MKRSLKSFLLGFSLLSLSVSGASETWKADVESLINQKGDPEILIRRLKAQPSFDQTLTKAIDKGGEDERLAVQAIRLTSQNSLKSLLLKKFVDRDMRKDNDEEYFLALVSLAKGKDAENILQILSEKVLNHSEKISSELKLSLIDQFVLQNEIPSARTLEILLDDPSFKLRTRVAETAYIGILKSPKDFENYLHKALKLSPYPVRLRAVESISSLPLEQRKAFQKELRICSKKDQNKSVRSACEQVRFIK